MVAAKKSLLRLVRRLAIQDELAAMRLRGRLVVPPLRFADVTARVSKAELTSR